MHLRFEWVGYIGMFVFSFIYLYTEIQSNPIPSVPHIAFGATSISDGIIQLKNDQRNSGGTLRQKETKNDIEHHRTS